MLWGQVLYGNVSGFDFAFYQNSYLYHTTRDVPWTVDPGSLEHMVRFCATRVDPWGCVQV